MQRLMSRPTIRAMTKNKAFKKEYYYFKASFLPDVL